MYKDPARAERRINYLLALNAGAHMNRDASLMLLSPLAADASQAEADARANVLKAAAVAHSTVVGNTEYDGYHKATGLTAATTLNAIADSSTLATCRTLTNGLLTWAGAHADASGVHFHDDTVLNAMSLTTATGSATLPQLAVDLNDLLAAFRLHFASASE